MGKIHLLEQATIDQIAAGEVIDRPVSVVKELTENAIDAGATAITIEVKEGGISLIRVTDNGGGIDKEDLRIAFIRHATSKIQDAKDLESVMSLGFRGEALSSIGAISRVELITRTHDSLVGSRYVMEGGSETVLEEVGAPEGTTIIVRDLFFNTPARKKFLKTPQTEGSHINDMVSKMALSRPDISFRLIINGQNKFHTSGNHNLKDVIYQIYGRDVARELLPLQYECSFFRLEGFIGKPLIARGSRTTEIYFINGRYIKSSLISKAVEEGYRNFLMQHKFPLCVFNVIIDPEFTDVNVHPAKMEIRFRNQQYLYEELLGAIRKCLTMGELAPKLVLEESDIGDGIRKTQGKAAERADAMENRTTGSGPETAKQNISQQNASQQNASQQNASQQNASLENASLENASGPGRFSRTPEPFEVNSNAEFLKAQEKLFEQEMQAEKTYRDMTENRHRLVADAPGASQTYRAGSEAGNNRTNSEKMYSGPNLEGQDSRSVSSDETDRTEREEHNSSMTEISFGIEDARQSDMFEEKLLTMETVSEVKLAGQLFDTYWVVEYRDTFMLIDQHAAHEKVNYERIIRELKNRQFNMQQMNPPKVITLSPAQQAGFQRANAVLKDMGFEIEPFGGNDYAVYGMPDNLVGISPSDLLGEILDMGDEAVRITPDAVYEKAASMACKSAIKGNQHISTQEAEKLIADLVTLENPYTCPHGRPTMIRMTKKELEKKFKRIV